MLTASLLMLISVLCGLAQTKTLTSADLKVLEGGKWTGNLTYMDYTSGKKTQINSNVTISRKDGESNVWIFAYEYPDEPKANGSAEVVLAADGKTFNGGSVIETASTSKDSMLRIVTTKPGTDNDRKALFRFSYTIGRNVFVIKKEAQLEGSKEWFTRNEYSWARHDH